MWDVGIHVTPFIKKFVFQNLLVHLKLVLILQYTMLLNYILNCTSEEP